MDILSGPLHGPIGPGRNDRVGRVRLVWQLVVNGIITGSMCALVGIGFGLIYSVGRFFHFAHGMVFTLGAYFVYLFSSLFSLSIQFSIILAIIFAPFVGCLIEIVVYRPLRGKGAGSLVILIASLGIYVVLQNTISIVFGDSTKSIRAGAVHEGIVFCGAHITTPQMAMVLICVLSVAMLTGILHKTRIGHLMRAAGSDPGLAAALGIDINRVILYAIVIASLLGSAAGILTAVDVDITPSMGLQPLMLGVIAAIVGGIGSIPGIGLGGMLLGIAYHLGVWKISSQWQDAIAFTILLVFLLIRPRGFLGRRINGAIL